MTIQPDAETNTIPQPSPSTSTSASPAASTLTNPNNTIHVSLTHAPLSIPFATAYTRHPTAGANILFLGTTRSYFLDPSRPVSRLSYTSYPALALRTLMKICTEAQTRHDLVRICVMHRLGDVAVGEESIVVSVSSAHRGQGWRGAEELLEQIKEKVEVWKREWFADGGVEDERDTNGAKRRGEEGERKEVGVWRANRESDRMGKRLGEEGIGGG